MLRICTMKIIKTIYSDNSRSFHLSKYCYNIKEIIGYVSIYLINVYLVDLRHE